MFSGETPNPHYRTLECDAVTSSKNFYHIRQYLIQIRQTVYDNVALMSIRKTNIKVLNILTVYL